MGITTSGMVKIYGNSYEENETNQNVSVKNNQGFKDNGGFG